MGEFTERLAGPAGRYKNLQTDILQAINGILERGNTAEVKRRKDGETIVLEVRKKIKTSVPQTGGAEGQAGP